MPVDPIDPPGVPVVPGDEKEKDLPAGAPGKIAPPRLARRRLSSVDPLHMARQGCRPASRQSVPRTAPAPRSSTAVATPSAWCSTDWCSSTSRPGWRRGAKPTPTVCRSRVTSSASCVATSSAGSSSTSANRPPLQLSPRAPATPPYSTPGSAARSISPVVGLDRRSVRAELPLRSDPELTNHPSALLLLRRGCSVLRHAARPADRRAPLPQRPAAPAGTRWAVLAMVLPLGRCFVQELITAEAPHSGRSVHIGKDDPWPAESTPTSATSCT